MHMYNWNQIICTSSSNPTELIKTILWNVNREKIAYKTKAKKSQSMSLPVQHAESGCSPVLHVAKEPNVQQAEDLQTELELDQLPWWKYLVKTQTAGHLATDHCWAAEQKTVRRNDQVLGDTLHL